MIKDFTPRPYDGENPLPTYVSNRRTYELIGTVASGYKITLARLTVGDSVSADTPLTHALFESFTDHGERMAIARTRVSGYDREFWAVKNVMQEVGIEFADNRGVTFYNSESSLEVLGEWFQGQNPDIVKIEVLTQIHP